MIKKYISLIFILILHIFLMTKLSFTAWPEMILWPFLLIRGWVPYKDIAIAHTPNLIFSLSTFYKFFGIGITQLQIFTWIMVLICDLLLFFIVKKIWNNKIAIFTLLLYVFLQLFFDGNGLWFDIVLAPLSLVLFYLIHKNNFFWGMVIWVVMFFTKQTAFWFLIPIFILLLIRKKEIVTNFKYLFLGTVFCLAIYLGILYFLNLLPYFYKWAINFGVFILPKASGQIQLPNIKNLTYAIFPYLVFIPLFVQRRKDFFELVIWSFAGMLGMYPRFEFFHFQPSLPFLAIAGGLIISEGLKSKKMGYLLIFYFSIFILLFANYFIRNFGGSVRFYEQDVQDVASYVSRNTSINDKIFVMNYWDNIYAFANRVPATDPWIPQLSWYTEIPGIQEKMVNDLRINKPKMIILKPYSDTGLSSYIPQKVYDFVRANYNQTDSVDGIDILTSKLK